MEIAYSRYGREASPTKRQPGNQPASTAYHEAGHAVARFALGRRLERATIVPSEDCLGLVQGLVLPKSWSGEYEEFRPSLELRAAEDHLICALAGPIAEARFRGRRNHVGAGRDYEQIADVLSALTGLGAVGKAYAGYVEAVADELVDLHWYLIEALANVLLTRRTLSGIAVHKTLRTAVELEARALGLWLDRELTAVGWRRLAFVVGLDKRDASGGEQVQSETA